MLAVVGTVVLLAYTAGQRQREIAIRVALGAARRDVLRVPSCRASCPAAIGRALGVVGAAFGTRLLASILVDVEPLDPPMFAAALATLGHAARLAALTPERQALTIDPVDTLRAEGGA